MKGDKDPCEGPSVSLIPMLKAHPQRDGIRRGLLGGAQLPRRCPGWGPRDRIHVFIRRDPSAPPFLSEGGRDPGGEPSP